MKMLINLSLVAVSFLSLNFASANDHVKSAKNTAEDEKPLTANVSYLGAQNNNPVFDIDFTKPEDKKVQLRIMDETGETLFVRTYNEGDHVNKKIMLNINPSYLNTGRKITFQLQSKGSNEVVKKSYDISSEEIYKNVLDVQAQ